jgi:hypothetical protein
VGNDRDASEKGGGWRELVNHRWGEREEKELGGKARVQVPGEFERYSPTLRKSMGCDFRANVCRLRAFDSERGLPAPTAKAKESWSLPWLPCKVSAVGNFHTQSLGAVGGASLMVITLQLAVL